MSRTLKSAAASAPGGGDLGALRARLARSGAPRGDVPRAQPPMLATLVDRVPAGPGWLFEVKWDGVRALARREGRRVTLAGRHGQDFTPRYPEVIEALAALPLERFVLDGEIVAPDAHGRPSFQRLQNRMHLTDPADVARARERVPVQTVVFDALALDGHDLRALPLAERKACLALALPPRGPVHAGEFVLEHGEAFLAAAGERRLEGIVAKKIDSAYTGGRSRDWLKIKVQLRQEFVIGGWTDPQGARPYFGALHLGLYEGDRLVYVAKVGTGFDEKTLKRLWGKLQPLARRTSPFASGTPGGRGHHWVEPRLVGEVRFTEWTDDGGIRHPAFLGLRDDKRPEECRREMPQPIVGGASNGGGAGDAAAGPRPPARRVRRGASAAPAPRGQATAAPAARAAGEATGPGSGTAVATITNPAKVFWPDEGYTKGDLVAYYETVAPWLLPYLRDRALVLTRHPDGIAGKSFYQKDAPAKIPGWIRTVRIRAETPPRDIDYIVVDGVEALRYVVNLGAIPLHLWASRVGSLDRPDWLVLDLDPKGAPFAHVVRIARALHAILEGVQVPSYPKTSGKTGLHVLVPLGARYDYAHARAFAHLLATLAVEAEPRIATVARPLRERGGKVYVDYGQNGPGQTIVAPFAVRPLPGAPVSCSLRWDEVDAGLDPRHFTIRTMPARLTALGDPMSRVLSEAVDLPAALERIKHAHG